MTEGPSPPAPPSLSKLVWGSAVASLLAASLAGAIFLARDQPTLARGVGLGYLAGALLTASWIGGAWANFGASPHKLRGATLGLWPLRGAVVVITFLCVDRFQADRNAAVAAFLATMVLGQVLQAKFYGRLAAHHQDQAAG